MSEQLFTSWGRLSQESHERLSVTDRHGLLPEIAAAASMLPRGNGRSYGDSCLNAGGALLCTRALDRFIDFDPQTGRLSCEAGVLLADILELVVGRGWFLPVVPGTRFVSVGGAIANDVHGKNHHRAGTFGTHVCRFELLRSDGQRLICSPGENAEWFAATIGGLGLTGLITWAEIQLRPIANPWMDTETIRFADLDDFFVLSAESDSSHEYTVAWVDCTRKRTRGLFTRGNHASASSNSASSTTRHKSASRRALRYPLNTKRSLINPLSVKAFNMLYFHQQLRRVSRNLQHYEPFFFPLDGILDWNRLYGRRGFFQYQCVIPAARGQEPMRAVLDAIRSSGMGSFLSVLKVFGATASPGMLSFPTAGATLALDFANEGSRSQQLFERLDAIVTGAGGRLYPAKDARMPGAVYRRGYPAYERFIPYIDPRFSSGFWRRVMGAE